MLKSCPEYLTTITNQLESVVLKYNYGVLQLLNQNRNYKVGNTFNVNVAYSVNIYGKPIIEDTSKSNKPNVFTELFNSAISNINNDENPILQKLYNLYKPTDTEKSAIKTNMVKYLDKLNTTYSNNLQTIISELSTYQQSLVLDLIKIEIINGANSTTTGWDGKKTEKGTVLPYITKGTDKVDKDKSKDPVPNNTFDELQFDIEKIHDYFDKVNKLLIDNEIITSSYESVGDFKPVEGGGLTDDVENKTFYMIVAREFNDENKLTGFINYVLTTNLTASNKLKNNFEKVVKDVAKEYNKELSKEEKIFEKFRKTKEFKDYSEGVEEELYPSGKERVLEYTTVLTDQEKQTANTIFSNLFSNKNTADKPEFFIEDIQNGKFNVKFN